jgi:hypothetical protein
MITLILFIACKEEQKPQELSSNTSDLESQYFNDYTSPQLKWGYINKSGNQVIPSIFDDARDFKEGLACASLGGRWGVIDLLGNTVIEFNYLDIQDFSEGKTIVQDFDHNRYYIDIIGDKLFDCEFDECFPFKDGIARYRNGEVYGFINDKGSPIEGHRYSFSTDFKKGYAVIAKGSNWGIIDVEGQEILKTEYDKIKISESIALRKHDNKYTFFNLKTKKQIGVSYEKAKPFSDGLAIVKLKGQQGIINIRGIFKSFNGSKINYLKENRLAVKHDKGYKIYDTLGNLVSDSIYDNVFRYHCGIAGMEKAEAWGYVDLEGNEILKPQLPIIWDCYDDRVRFITNSGYAYLDTEMKMVIAPKYYEARDFKEGMAPVQSINLSDY